MAKNVVILGAGLVGKAIAIDLAENFDVTSVDINPTNLEIIGNEGIKTIEADLSQPEELKSIVKDFDIVVGALPGFMGFKAAKHIIESKKDLIDISFFPEDPFELDELAKENGVTVITDCGVAPGMGNIILGYHNENMEVSDYTCYVGGLPFKREWPYEYKAVFSPLDVIEEYVRPARYIVNGGLVVKEALSEAELLEFKPIGTLEAWNSDGLRSLIKTMKIPNMIEKTLRYPGTIEYLRVLRESGFFSYDDVIVSGKKVRPIDLTANLLFSKWELKKGEEDFTLMRVIIEGKEKGKEKTFIYDLFDRYDRETETTSMARTTGYTCTAVVNLFAEGKFTRKGICPPEYLGEDTSNFKYIVDYLKERNVDYCVSEK